MYKQIITSSVTLLLLDVLFLYFQQSTFLKYLNQIQSNTKLKYTGIIICYLFLLFALNYFIIIPNKSVLDAFVLGLCIYGVYEGTTYATLNKWPIHLLVQDTLWGGILFATSTWIARHV